MNAEKYFNKSVGKNIDKVHRDIVIKLMDEYQKSFNQIKEDDPRYDLWVFLSEEHDLILTEDELDCIITEVKKLEPNKSFLKEVGRIPSIDDLKNTLISAETMLNATDFSLILDRDEIGVFKPLLSRFISSITNYQTRVVDDMIEELDSHVSEDGNEKIKDFGLDLGVQCESCNDGKSLPEGHFCVKCGRRK